MNSEEIVKLVYNINNELNNILEKSTKILDYSFLLNYNSNGYADSIEFLNNIIWCSEYDEYDEEGDSLLSEKYLKDKIIGIVQELNKIKFYE